MIKKAEEILNNEIKTIITANDYSIVKRSFVKLISLADVLDSIGDEKNATRIDEIVKEATGIWDFLLSGLGAGIDTKNEGGKSIIDAIKGGNVGKFFDKDTLVKVITNFLVGGGIGMMAGEIVELLTAKVPILKWFGDSKFIKMAVETALTYAVLHSDFVSKLVDGIVQQVEGMLGMQKAPANEVKPTTKSTMPTPDEGTDTKPFQVALPGAKV